MAETWRGIYPISSFVLEALGRKRDSGPAGALTEREQVLLIVVEFWAAAAHGTLQKLLLPDPHATLAQARQAFGAIGAVRIVSLLRVAVEELDGRVGNMTAEAVIDQLDERLARTDDNVDDLVVRYLGATEETLVDAGTG
ncbi:MAG TPA: hypothetical protein VK505_03585 [Steroidobacteraceae bacterium]|jgi:hypothetical protein|nr:hypothetical protein [Steroidobacteraceae bacterium]